MFVMLQVRAQPFSARILSIYNLHFSDKSVLQQDKTCFSLTVQMKPTEKFHNLNIHNPGLFCFHLFPAEGSISLTENETLSHFIQTVSTPLPPTLLIFSLIWLNLSFQCNRKQTFETCKVPPSPASCYEVNH